jgi:hypothetical protein
MTVRLHYDEVRIDEDLVRQLLRAQLPDMANQDLRLVPAQGTDNVVFRLGEELSVRLPRKPSAVRSLLIEREWLPSAGRNRQRHRQRQLRVGRCSARPLAPTTQPGPAHAVGH